jgi:hypothetical protein
MNPTYFSITLLTKLLTVFCSFICLRQHCWSTSCSFVARVPHPAIQFKVWNVLSLPICFLFRNNGVLNLYVSRSILNLPLWRKFFKDIRHCFKETLLLIIIYLFFNSCGGTSGTAATTGLLYQARVIVTVIVEKLVEWGLARETEVLGENLPPRHFVHHKSHMTRPGFWTRAAAVGGQRLTAWAMARPSFKN